MKQMMSACAMASLMWLVGPAPAGTYELNFPTSADRAWIGPEFFANRLQDWQLRDGRIECIEAGERLPIRTLHLLTRTLGGGDGSFSMQVTIDCVDTDATHNDEQWAGFLIGAGGTHVDYRLTAMTHHRPAEDGGLLALVDGRGIVTVRDFSSGGSGGGTWAIGGAVEPEDVPELEPAQRDGLGFGDDAPCPITLHLDAEPVGDGYTLVLTARRADTGAVLSGVEIDDVRRELVDGAIALVSHRGPAKSNLGHAFTDWMITGTKVLEHHDRVFGPILCTQYTLSDGVLNMTAQLPPLDEDDVASTVLQLRDPVGGEWTTAATGTVIKDSYTVPFRIEGYDADHDVPYRVVCVLADDPECEHVWHGTIRKEPKDQDEFTAAVFTGHKVYTGGLKWNHGGIWFPHNELVSAVAHHDPDFLFFSGDQVYEGDLTPAQGRPPEKAMLDYLYKWYRWCWAFRDLAKDRPCVCIPDDHDVYHGNIWGAGGRKAQRTEKFSAQDSGGYTMPAFFVNAVHRTQTSHLPDPHDATPVDQGITVYYTTINYGGMSFAVIADRQFKSSPMVMVPAGDFKNGWPQDPKFDAPAQADVPGAVLLGERQLAFLEEWSQDWPRETWMKVLLSQTIFANVATIPEAANGGGVIPGLPTLESGVYLENQKLATDGDSNGWPQTGRNKAVAVMRKAFAVHLAGDQHLGSTIQYGLHDWRDAGFAFCVPSIGNTWPRRWFPPAPGSGPNREPGSPQNLGDFRDGFGNLVTVRAVANPYRTGIEPTNLNDRAPGYGIVRFDRKSRDVTMECWPRSSDPAQPDAPLYPGWPIVFNQLDGFAPGGGLTLPPIRVLGVEHPVVQVIDEASGEIVFTIRIAGGTFQPRVDHEGTYTIRVGEPDEGEMPMITGLKAGAYAEDDTIELDLTK